MLDVIMKNIRTICQVIAVLMIGAYLVSPCFSEEKGRFLEVTINLSNQPYDDDIEIETSSENDFENKEAYNSFVAEHSHIVQPGETFKEWNEDLHFLHFLNGKLDNDIYDALHENAKSLVDTLRQKYQERIQSVQRGLREKAPLVVELHTEFEYQVTKICTPAICDMSTTDYPEATDGFIESTIFAYVPKKNRPTEAHDFDEVEEGAYRMTFRDDL